MKFKELSHDDQRSFFNSLSPSNPVRNESKWGTIFWWVKPCPIDHSFPLQKKYKPSTWEPALHTIVLQQRKRVFEGTGREKLLHNDLAGDNYVSEWASFKLHIGINDIADLDASIIEGLHTFLIDQARSAQNMSFLYKVVMPFYLRSSNHPRFLDNDQFTLYFDPYSSVAEMMALSDAVNTYLQQHLPDNARPLGPKDIIGFNSFVTGRFDTSTLNARYNVYTFYDEQLRLFFERYKDQPEALQKVPVCVFETVFNNIMIDESITDLQQDTFGEKYGDYIQRQLDLIVQKPEKYIKYPELLALKADPDAMEKYKGMPPKELVFTLLKKRLAQLDDATHRLKGSKSEQLARLREMIENRDVSKISEEELQIIREKLDVVCEQDKETPHEEAGFFKRLLDRIIQLIDWFVALFRPRPKLSDNPSTLFAEQQDETSDYNASANPSPSS